MALGPTVTGWVYNLTENIIESLTENLTENLTGWFPSTCSVRLAGPVITDVCPDYLLQTSVLKPGPQPELFRNLPLAVEQCVSRSLS